MRNVGKTPKLRFPQFQGDPEWDELALSEMVTSLDAGVSVNSGDRPAKNGEIGVLKTSAVTNGIFESQENKVVLDEIEIGRVKEAVRGDTIIISRMNTPALVGANAYVETSLKNIFLPDRLWAAKAKPGTCMRFLAAVLGSDKGRAALSKLAKGSSGSMKNITKPDVLAFLVIAPSLAEQQRIATCLSSLDDLIAAQSANLEALKSHKKGLIQQFFPSEGETVPHLRFPEFQDAPEWEETTLGEIVHFESGGTPSKQNPGFWDGSIPWVSAKDMKQFFLNDPEDHITSVAVDDGAKQVPAGTVLMLTRGMTLFKDVPICVVRRSMSFNQDVKALRAQGGLNQQFLPHLLVANRQRLLGMVDAAGHGTGRLNTDELKSLIVTYPHESEQMRIASCLANLEFLIPTHKDKLEALKTHKQGLCHQLFPS